MRVRAKGEGTKLTSERSKTEKAKRTKEDRVNREGARSVHG